MADVDAHVHAYAHPGRTGEGDQPTSPQPGMAAGYAAPAGKMTRLMYGIGSRMPRWAAPLAVLGCAAGALGYTQWADPTNSAADAIPTCLVKLTTGLDCPGCGGTRAAWYLMHGDLGAAARHHLMFVFMVPFVIYLYVAWAGQLIFGWKLPQFRIGPTAIAVFVSAWALFMVLRNLPWAPFTYFYV